VVLIEIMIKINTNTHLINDVPFYKSDNCDNRPIGIEIDTIIIHCISLPEGKYANNNIIDLFQNKLDIEKDKSFKSIVDLKVSAHILIRRNGDIIQFVPLNLRAWHAGKSEYNHRVKFNDFSIGIELEGTVNSRFEEEQYLSLIEIISEIKTCYPKVIDDNIVGHNIISPDRKKDPGEYFDWKRIKEKS